MKEENLLAKILLHLFDHFSAFQKYLCIKFISRVSIGGLLMPPARDKLLKGIFKNDCKYKSDLNSELNKVTEVATQRSVCKSRWSISIDILDRYFSVDCKTVGSDGKWKGRFSNA